ncbi:cytochrome P450 [Actinomadura scrupuli]|uniref:cytochrome P450 n=1 Tax=Actinomadura scrupuli TaxID=559629 RepID=UPI003D983C60
MVSIPPPATAATVARTDPDAERLFLEIMADPLRDDPYDGYRRLRELAPALLTGDGTLVLTRFEDCDAALRHRALGKSDRLLELGLAVAPAERPGSVVDLLRHSMLFANPPDHTRLRRLVSSAFTSRHVEALRDAVTARTGALLEALAAEPGADFMAAVALPLPVNVISDLLGVPEADRLAFTPKVHALVTALDPTADLECLTLGEAAGDELFGYFSALLADKRARPGDDLFSRLAASHEDDALDESEMISTALLLFIAGFETTTNLLGNGLHALLEWPDELRRLRDHPELIPAAVEELLRYDSPVQVGARTVLEPTTLAGADLEPGLLVLTALGAANHDPARFDGPDRLDVGRADSGHLAFAAGIHFCLGAHLTRLEAQIFLEVLVRRYDVARAGEPTRRPGFTLRGFDHLPVALSPRPDGGA